MRWYSWSPYVSVAERRRMAAKEIEKLRKRGRTISPVVIEGRAIAHTFWGKAWCDNLEGYSDFESRLPRGRTYARNGSVVDLQIEAGKVTALVQGSAMYSVTIKIQPVEPARWARIVAECSGKIDSVVELLQGKLSGGVMEVITRGGAGLFPAPRQIALRCTCPDAAVMCKHVAAALYGGFVICSDEDGSPSAARLDPPEGVEAVVVVPDEAVPTEEARDAIPAEIPLADAVANVAAASQLVLGIQRSDLTLIERGLADRIHQPRRAGLYPRSMELVEDARELGAIGATISGAGPSVLVWTFWQSTGKVVEGLRERAEGWAEVRRVPFSPLGADVPEL